MLDDFEIKFLINKVFEVVLSLNLHVMRAYEFLQISYV